MEMFALIKDGNSTRIVKSDEVEEKANFIIRKMLNDFFDALIEKNGENYKFTYEDADLFESYDEPFSEYISDKILRKNINKKRKFELKKLLRNVFNEFNIDTRLISNLDKNYNLFSYFYSEKGNVCFNLNGVRDSFSKLFGDLVSNQLVKELNRQLSVYDYSLEYNVLELKNFILSSDNIVEVNRRNFEYLLHEVGEISDPRTLASLRHKCYNCDNLSPLHCEKAKIHKKRIDAYPFINQGYQVFITTDYKDLSMVSFIVEDCNDYKSYNDGFVDNDEYSFVKKRRR